MLISVYGTLRRGFHNNSILKNNKGSKYMGTFETKPKFTLKSLETHPALLMGGNTSITMEVFRIDDKTSKQIEELEGFYGPDDKSNLYNKRDIKTPFGEASVYIYNGDLSSSPTCFIGDWKEYLLSKKLNNA